MAEDVVINNPEPTQSTDLIRKVVAAVVGVIVIIILVLLAKWLGDRVRERFFPKTTTANVQVIPPEDTANNPAGPTNNPGSTNPANSKMATAYSAIPATGPNDLNYIVLALFAVAGLFALSLTKKS